MSTVTLVTMDPGQWEGVYVDGEIFRQGHTVNHRVFLRIMENFDVESTEVRTYSGERVQLPNSLEELEE